MPFSRTQEINTLVSTIDTAMARADDIGNDMIRDLMPDLRDAIDEVNAALREVDALLFEGLRDEAVSLHDEDFAALASRLNLEDRDGWPELERFFVVEGISPPPKIDYDTLSAMESAHAELEELRRPLDRLRRLALERAPLSRRLALLRKLSAADPTKPVWTQSITDHEEARVAELHDETRRVLAMRRPEAIAELYAELVDPEWGIPIPRELVKATRGADLWVQLRAAAEQAAAAAEGLEAGWQELQQSLPSPELIDRLRHWRHQWDQAQQMVADTGQYLRDCPSVAGLIREERLYERVDALRPRVDEALGWLAAQDAAEAYAAQLQQLCGQLEYLCDHKPAVPAESGWLADSERLSAEVMRLCQVQPGLVYPDFLRERVEKAVADVWGRAGRRARFKLLTWGVGIAAACLLLAMLVWWVRSRSDYGASLAALKALRTRAEVGEFPTEPEEVSTIRQRYPADRQITDVIRDISRLVDAEKERQESLTGALGEFDEALEAARRALASRQGAERLAVWPPDVVAAARAWRSARRFGGLPGKRIPKADPTASNPNAVVQRLHKQEEDRITDREEQQRKLEADYQRASVAQVREQNQEFLARLSNAADEAALTALRDQLDEFLAIQSKQKTSGVGELLEKTSPLLFPPESAHSLKATRVMIEQKMKNVGNPGSKVRSPPRTDQTSSPNAAPAAASDDTEAEPSEELVK
jgi:hypothetical protein